RANGAVSAGSSAGAAAAAAAGLVRPATLPETGASIRQPAALCGTSGVRPTYGTVSRYGMIAYGSSLDQGGPMARNALDLLELLDPISRFDERDSTSLEQCAGKANQPGRVRAAFEAAAGKSDSAPLAGLRIGVPDEFLGAGLAPDVAAAIEAALQQYEALGAVRTAVSLPLTEQAISAYYVIATAEASSNLSRFDGVRYGHRAAKYDDITNMTARSRAEGFGPEVQRGILTGAYVLSQGYYDAYYLQAQRVRRLMAQDYQRALTECDVIMGPVAPTVAGDLGSKVNDPVAMYLADVYTLGANLAGLPAMSIPCGFGQGQHQRRPVGLQIIGNYFDEGRLLRVAHCYQQATDWHQRRPEQQ